MAAMVEDLLEHFLCIGLHVGVEVHKELLPSNPIHLAKTMVVLHIACSPAQERFYGDHAKGLDVARRDGRIHRAVSNAHLLVRQRPNSPEIRAGEEVKVLDF